MAKEDVGRTTVAVPGVPLRDYLAAQVAAGLAQRWASRDAENIARHAELCYQWADAMLVARDRKPEPASVPVETAVMERQSA